MAHINTYVESLDQKNYGLRVKRLSLSISEMIFNNSYSETLHETLRNSEHNKSFAQPWTDSDISEMLLCN